MTSWRLYANNGRVPVACQKVVYLTGFLAQLTSTPAMGLNRILGDTLTKLSDDHMLRSWSIYQEQNGCVSVKIKFDVGADAVKHDNMTYKRKYASQVARDRRRSDHWKSQQSTLRQHPGQRRHMETSGSVTPAKSRDTSTGVCDGNDIGMMTRSMTTSHEHTTEILRCDISDSVDISPTVTPLLSPYILYPLATPFHHEYDLALPDLAFSVTPDRDPPKVCLDISERPEDPVASPSSLDVVDTSPGDLDNSDTCSVSSAESSATTCSAECGIFWCGYGGGQSGQDRTKDGLSTCTRCHLAVCALCLDDGRHSRHKQFIISDDTD